MTLARIIPMITRKPRIRNPTTVGTAICHAGMEVEVGQTGRRNERVWRIRVGTQLINAIK